MSRERRIDRDAASDANQVDRADAPGRRTRADQLAAPPGAARADDRPLGSSGGAVQLPDGLRGAGPGVGASSSLGEADADARFGSEATPEDEASAAQDSTRVVQQMLPLFRNDAARWARFIKGLKGFAAKKRFA